MTREIKFKIKVIPDTVLNKSIKSLKDKLIKEVVSIQNKKKYLIGNGFEPSVDVAGGVWYNEAATVGEITEYLNNLTVDCRDLFTQKLTGQEIEGLMQSLILDKKIVEAESTGKGDFAKIPPGEQCYRCANTRGLSKTGALASIPCGVYPRLNECTPDGIISPTTCVYFKKWLDFE
ncbi:hypothetical protein C5167_028017 [Papaver somniferum]|nr:hypothetical protein C5167_028017 [Papaver somniferum]